MEARGWFVHSQSRLTLPRDATNRDVRQREWDCNSYQCLPCIRTADRDRTGESVLAGRQRPTSKSSASVLPDRLKTPSPGVRQLHYPSEIEWIRGRIFNNSVLTAKKTPHFTVTKIDRLTLFKEIIAVYSENRKKPTNIHRRQSADLLINRAGGTYIYHWRWKC
jgi:hypothetical protein